MAALRPMAGARSPAKIRPKSTLRRRTSPPTRPKKTSPPARPSVAPSSRPTRSARPNPRRSLAKNLVAAGLAKRCTIQRAYAIGVSKPLSLYVDTHGTGTVGDDKIETAIQGIEKLGGMTPRGIRTHLGLNKPIYERTAA